MNKDIVLYWFRQDLRLTDNPALSFAKKTIGKNGQILPIYILDDINSKNFSMGSASRWWLYHSLESLKKSLFNNLNLYSGNPEDIILQLIEDYNITTVCWNRCYEPWRIARDKNIKAKLESMGIHVYSDNGALLWEPWEVTKKDGTNYKVFTPFYQRGCLETLAPREPLSKPNITIDNLLKDKKDGNIRKYRKRLTDLALIPEIPWYKAMESIWEIGEQASVKKLKKFISNGLDNYKEGRNFPALNNVSRLSPHLHFGEISPNQAWYTAKKLYPKNDNNLKVFLSELGWREFSYSLLYFYPSLPNKNWREVFDKFPWRKSNKLLTAWQKGLTGYPIVDAGMRELWQTGYIHNRVRMIVGSFLVKNLLIDWREGEKWFWDCLVDADLASNSASWQWVAGSGADAAPYFRIFNPVTQGQKFDPEGEYTKKYVPELANMPSKYLYNPFDAPSDILEAAGVKLGINYPKPIVELKQSREKALESYDAIR